MTGVQLILSRMGSAPQVPASPHMGTTPQRPAAGPPPATGKDPGPWKIDYTQQVAKWLRTLSEKDANRIGAAIRQLEREGPTLGKGRAKLIKSSSHHNMKELRSVGGHMRVLFAFDRNKHAVLLVGGDKTGNWRGWYERNIPIADKLYEKHLRSLGKEGAWAATARRAGDRSAGAGR